MEDTHLSGDIRATLLSSTDDHPHPELDPVRRYGGARDGGAGGAGRGAGEKAGEGEGEKEKRRKGEKEKR